MVSGINKRMKCIQKRLQKTLNKALFHYQCKSFLKYESAKTVDSSNSLKLVTHAVLVSINTQQVKHPTTKATTALNIFTM